MKIFMFHSFCIFSIMLLLIITGVHAANDGIQKMRGDHDPHSPSEFSILKSDLHTSVNDGFSHNIKEKQKKLEKINTFNAFSFLGNQLAEGISNLSKYMIQLVAK